TVRGGTEVEVREGERTAKVKDRFFSGKDFSGKIDAGQVSIPKRGIKSFQEQRAGMAPSTPEVIVGRRVEPPKTVSKTVVVRKAKKQPVSQQDVPYVAQFKQLTKKERPVSALPKKTLSTRQVSGGIYEGSQVKRKRVSSEKLQEIKDIAKGGASFQLLRKKPEEFVGPPEEIVGPPRQLAKQKITTKGVLTAMTPFSKHSTEALLEGQKFSKQKFEQFETYPSRKFKFGKEQTIPQRLSSSAQKLRIDALTAKSRKEPFEFLGKSIGASAVEFGSFATEKPLTTIIGATAFSALVPAAQVGLVVGGPAITASQEKTRSLALGRYVGDVALFGGLLGAGKFLGKRFGKTGKEGKSKDFLSELQKQISKEP
ncbi:unnamed protein product, partial [marine sediment metagenome]